VANAAVQHHMYDLSRMGWDGIGWNVMEGEDDSEVNVSCLCEESLTEIVLPLLCLCREGKPVSFQAKRNKRLPIYIFPNTTDGMGCDS